MKNIKDSTRKILWVIRRFRVEITVGVITPEEWESRRTVRRINKVSRKLHRREVVKNVWSKVKFWNKNVQATA